MHQSHCHWPVEWQDDPLLSGRFTPNAAVPKRRTEGCHSPSPGASSLRMSPTHPSQPSGSHAQTEIDDAGYNSDGSTKTTYGSEFGGISEAHAQKKRKRTDARSNGPDGSSSFTSPLKPPIKTSNGAWAAPDPQNPFTSSASKPVTTNNLFRSTSTTLPPEGPSTSPDRVRSLSERGQSFLADVDKELRKKDNLIVALRTRIKLLEQEVAGLKAEVATLKG